MIAHDNLQDSLLWGRQLPFRFLGVERFSQCFSYCIQVAIDLLGVRTQFAT
jgi:hypothetical protein